ncbi:extracellular solute-binding protein [Thermasporomyces composti]|nr:extracellular solute-binding protein [Thermasporomyces composti]
MRTLMKFLVAGVASTVALAAAGCGGENTSAGSSGEGKTVRLYIGGDVNVRGLWEKTLIPAFREAHPGYDVRVTFSEHGVNDTTTLAKLGAAVKADQDAGFDLADSGLVRQAATSGLLAKVDTTSVPNLANVDESALEPVDHAAVPYRGSSVVLAYNSSKVKEPPQTLDELLAWIKANPGKFTYNSPSTGGSGQSFVTTVLDKFLSEEDRQKMVEGYVPELESLWDEGFAVLKELHPAIYQGVYPNGNQDVLNLLGKGEIWMAPVWSDMALSSMESGLLGPEIKLTQIRNPSFTGGAAYLGMPKNARNKEAALKLLNWVLEPEQQQKIVEVLAGYPAINLEKMPAEVQEKFAGLETQNLRLTYSQKMISDLNNLWQQKVPG